MKRIYLPVLLFLFGLSNLNAQPIDERVYIQTDRDFYSKGETVFMKGYIISSGETIAATNLFAELLDTSLNRLAVICMPVIDGTAVGSLVIPKEAVATSVFLRAYTDAAVTQDKPFQFIKPIAPGFSPATVKVANEKPVFFPEGGKLVVNADNTVAFKAAGSFEGSIKNSKGITAVTIKPVYNGMGLFTLRPEKGEKYFCHWTENGKESVTLLPASMEDGIALHAYQSGDMLHFELDNGGSAVEKIRKPRVQLLIDNEEAFLVTLNMSVLDRFGYSIPLQEFKPGFAELRVLDTDSAVVASRVLFITKKSFGAGIKAEVVKKNFDKRGENRVSINFHDTLLRYVSVSVTDAAYAAGTPGNGVASVLLPAGFPSVPSNTGNESEPDIADLAVLTLGHIPASVNSETAKKLPPGYLQLSGVVKRGKKLVADKEVFVGIRSEYTGKELYKVVTDNQGRFTLEGVVIYGDAYVHCRMPGSNEELEAEFQLTLPKANNDAALLNLFKATARSMIPQAEAVAALPKDNTPQSDTIVFSEKTIVLEEAIVKTNPLLASRKRLEELEKKYVDGTAFGGYAASGETLDVMNDPLSGKMLDIFMYIGSKMRSVSLRTVKGVKQLYYFGRGQGGETMVTVFYLNNSKIDRDMMEGIRLDEIAVIKFIPMLGSEPGFPPALVIFLKKPGDQGYWEKDPYQLSEQKVTGYTVSKDFVAPDYTNTENNVQTDYRKSLLWQPYTPVEKGIAEIKFFNNDITKKVRISVQGITGNGNIVFFEKILE